MPNIIHFGELLKPEVCGQTVLLDRLLSKEQKLAKNAKIEKLKCDILSNFQTVCLTKECCGAQ